MRRREASRHGNGERGKAGLKMTMIKRRREASRHERR